VEKLSRPLFIAKQKRETKSEPRKKGKEESPENLKKGGREERKEREWEDRGSLKRRQPSLDFLHCLSQRGFEGETVSDEGTGRLGLLLLR